MCSRFGKQSGRFLKCLNRLTTWPSNSTPGYIPKKNENICVHKTFPQMNIIHSQQPKSGNSKDINCWMDKQNPVHPHTIISSHKKERSTVTCYAHMNLENIMLRKRSQTQRPHVVPSHWHEISRIGESVGTERRVEFGMDSGMGSSC